MANPALFSAPAHEVLTHKEVQSHLRASDDEDPALLWAINMAARQAAEDFTSRRFVTQTLDYSLDNFPAGDHIELPGGRLSSITSLKYTESDDSETTWASTNYDTVTTHEPGWLQLGYGISWPSVTLRPRDGVVIRYVVGYGTGDQVPASIRQAILLIAGHLYNNREDVVVAQGFVGIEVPQTSAYLLYPHKLHHF